MPNLMTIIGTGDSGGYETDSNTLTAMLETYLPASVDHLKAVINERVTGNPKGDAFYQCSANNVMECLMILADFATGENSNCERMIRGH